MSDFYYKKTESITLPVPVYYKAILFFIKILCEEAQHILV